MSPDNEFGLSVLLACLCLYVALVSFPTGRAMIAISVAVTCLLAAVTLVFTLETPNPRHIDFGPMYRSITGGSLTGFSISAAIYNVLRGNAGHSWVYRVLGLPLGAALATGVIVVSGMIAP